MNGRSVVVIGGAGHIGLPLSVFLAKHGFIVKALDIDEASVKKINLGETPFFEENMDEMLSQVISEGTFHATSNNSIIAESDVIIVCVGTPVDENLSPVPRIFSELFVQIKPFLNKNQLVILRSTVYPGTTRAIGRLLSDIGTLVAFCPERILQGKALEELSRLPQIISGTTDQAVRSAIEFFSEFTSVITATIEEAEFAKLFLNTYRYIEFATTNQLYMIANDAGVDYARLLKIMKYDYPRAEKLPIAGLTAGPCLLKDTMQLVAYSQNRFSLGTAAFFANEGLALYIVAKIQETMGLMEKTIGIFGMAFKADCDDIRSSLSYRVRKALELAGAHVLATDRHVRNDWTLVSEEEVIANADCVIICTPHSVYKNIDFKNKPVVDIWNLLGRGSLIEI